MDNNYVFVNNAINDSVILYCEYKDEEGVNKESFLACVTQVLCKIYGEEDILNKYYDKDEEGFKELLTSYGFGDYDSFIDDFESFYEMDYDQEDNVLQRKNKYFNLVQKHLIDMMVCKNNEKPILIEDRKEIYEMLFTANSKSFYKKTYALNKAYDPYEIDDYFMKQGLLVGDRNGKNSD